MDRAAARGAAGTCSRGRPDTRVGSAPQRRGRSAPRPAPPASPSGPRPAGERTRRRVRGRAPRWGHRPAPECRAPRAAGPRRVGARRSSAGRRTGGADRRASRPRTLPPGGPRYPPRRRWRRTQSAWSQLARHRAPGPARPPPARRRIARPRRARAVGGASPAGLLACCRPSLPLWHRDGRRWVGCVRSRDRTALHAE